MAVRSNVGNIVGMKKNIYAAWCHVCSSEKKCTNRCDIANVTKTRVRGIGLPSEIIKHAKEVFDGLSDNKLLTKCLHGKTQNQNEAFIQQNNME